MSEEDTRELWLSEGEAWFPDAAALCARLGADYIVNVEGELYAGIAGKGEVLLADVIKAPRDKKSTESKVVQIKP